MNRDGHCSSHNEVWKRINEQRERIHLLEIRMTEQEKDLNHCRESRARDFDALRTQRELDSSAVDELIRDKKELGLWHRIGRYISVHPFRAMLFVLFFLLIQDRVCGLLALDDILTLLRLR